MSPGTLTPISSSLVVSGFFISLAKSETRRLHDTQRAAKNHPVRMRVTDLPETHAFFATNMELPGEVYRAHDVCDGARNYSGGFGGRLRNRAATNRRVCGVARGGSFVSRFCARSEHALIGVFAAARKIAAGS